jgi:DNA-binding NtrC family response regulator
MKTILIVDDDHAGGRLGEILTCQGYLSLLARDARTALAILGRSAPVDLVVSETELLDMDGMDFLLRLRRTCPALPIIVVTAACSVEKYLQAANLGVIEYLTKPLYMKEFSRIVRLALDQSVSCNMQPGPGQAISAAHCEDGPGFPRRGG